MSTRKKRFTNIPQEPRYIYTDIGSRERELEARLKAIAEIIEAVENRCLAVDGPVRPTLEEMRPTEMVKIYKLAKV